MQDVKFLKRAGWASMASLTLLFAVHRYRINEEAKLKIDATLIKGAGAKGGDERKRKPAVNARFFASVKKLLKVLIPEPVSAEAGYALFVALMLGLRTVADIWMISNSTKIERAIIERNPAGFKKYVLRFMSVFLPLSVINQSLKLGLQELKIRFRVNLTEHLYKKYLNSFVYYQVNNIDTRIQNVDQLLTQDVDKFCQSCVDFYSNVSKPLLDVLIYARALVKSHGASAPVTMLGYLALAASTLTTLRRPLAKLTVQEQELEGQFRYVNARLITNSEEVAFYGGAAHETNVIHSVFNRLVRHLRRAMEFRFSMGVIDNIGAKYLSICVGFWVVSRPFFDKLNTTYNAMNNSDLMEHYYASGRMLVKLGEAVGRLVLAGRELSRLAGFTDRVDQLSRVLDELAQGKYQRTVVEGSQARLEARGNLVLQDKTEFAAIVFQDVPLITPNGETLVESLSFRVDKGVNTFVSGPNGCGKSSLFRVLAELWPLYGGTLIKPKGEVFYVPQRPYMCIGTLRDQITYPDGEAELKRKGVTDADLLELLRMVKLEYLVPREGGLDAVNDWMDVLSGGEKQRISFTRLYHHRPQVAVLDECSSAVSIDVEHNLYVQCKALGMTLFTISHRNLRKYHEKLLSFDGRGSYSFTDINESDH